MMVAYYSFIMILCLFIILISFPNFSNAITTINACKNYQFDSPETTANTFRDLNCAVLSSVPLIYVNQSFSFLTSVNVPSNSDIKIVGTSDNITLSTSLSRLFNISSSSSSLYLSNLIMNGNGGDFGTNPGLITLVGGSLTIFNSTLIKSVAFCGAGVETTNATLRIIKSKISNMIGLSDACPGALDIKSSNLTISGSIFERNIGRDYGGAIGIYFSKAEIEDTQFINNFALTGSGGCISSTQSTISISNCLFKGSAAAINGGGIIAVGGKLSINDTVFHHNNGTNSGGAIYLQQSFATLVNVSITQNRGGDGAGIAVDNSAINIFGSRFSGNNADEIGGAAYLNKVGTTIIKNTSFEGNFAFSAGAAIAFQDGHALLIEDSIMMGNIVSLEGTATALGGVFYGQNALLHIDNSHIGDSFAGQGGVAYLFNCEVNMTRVNVFNTVSQDSAIYITSQSKFSFVDSIFYNNTGETSSSGITCSGSLRCDIINSVFDNNTSSELACLYIETSAGLIVNTRFLNNVAKGTAAGVYFKGAIDTIVDNCTFSNNNAATYGGAIAVDLRSSVTFNYTTFQNNIATSGGAMYIFDYSHVSIYYSNFSDNNAHDSGGSIYVGSKSTLNISETTLTSSTAPFGGAIYASYESIVTLKKANINYCTAGFSGGAVSLLNYAAFVAYDSVLYQNTGSIGGAISAQYNCYIFVSKTVLVQNSAFGYGGAVYASVSCNVVLFGSILRSNTASFGGGAMYLEGTSSAFLGAAFLSNHDGISGGTIFVINSQLALKASIFLNNGGTAYQGGVMFITSNSDVFSSNCNYTGNVASFGGTVGITQSSFVSNDDAFIDCNGDTGSCIYSVETSNVTLINSFVAKNLQPTSSNGILYMTSGKLNITESTFTENTVFSNGVLYLLSVIVSITGSVFSRNSAVGADGSSGGALFIGCSLPCLEIKNLEVSITGSSFSRNEAAHGYGGGIYIYSFPGQVVISGSTFTGNTAINGGGIASYGTVVKVTNSSMIGNGASQGGGGMFWSYSPAAGLSYSNVVGYGNKASYGNLSATNLFKIASYFPPKAQQVSGQPLVTPIFVYLLDYYNQIVTNSSLLSLSSQNVYATAYNNSGVLQGSTIVTAAAGVAKFSQLIVTGRTGHNLSIEFSVPGANVPVQLENVYLRQCISGEVTVSYSGSAFSTCERCGPGTYSFDPTDSVCNDCPANTVCPGGNVLNLNYNYWRVDANSASVLRCAIPNACLGGSNISTQCAYGQTGPYCSVCEAGFTKSQNGLCYSCDNSSSDSQQLASTITFIIGLGLIAIAFKFQKRIKKFYEKATDSIMKNRRFRTLRVKGKILIAFMQIVYQIGPSLNVVFPLNFSEYLNYYSFFQLSFFYVPDIGCIVTANYYSQLIVNTLLPFAVFFVIAVVINLLVLRAKRLNERNPSYTAKAGVRDVITAAFAVSYLVLVSVSTKVLQVFQCETFDNGESYLVADYSINCNSPDRSFYIAYGSAMILVYPLGIPAIYAIILIRNRKRINPYWQLVIDSEEKAFVSNAVIQREKIKVRNTYEDISTIKMLYDSYTPKRWYFELFDCARRLGLGAIPVLILRGTTLQTIIVLLVSLFSVAGFMYFMPYIHAHDNQLAILAQWSITLVVISALVIQVQALQSTSADTGHQTAGLGVVLIVLNVSIILFTIMTTFAHSKSLSAEEKEKDKAFEEEEKERKMKEQKKKRMLMRNNNNNNNDNGDDSGVSDSDDEGSIIDSDDEAKGATSSDADAQQAKEKERTSGNDSDEENRAHDRSSSLSDSEVMNPMVGEAAGVSRAGLGVSLLDSLRGFGSRTGASLPANKSSAQEPKKKVMFEMNDSFNNNIELGPMDNKFATGDSSNNKANNNASVIIDGDDDDRVGGDTQRRFAGMRGFRDDSQIDSDDEV